MQTDSKELYRLTSKRTGKPEQLYKDIGNFVFGKLYEQLRKPRALITRLKGVGSWYLRKKRMDIQVTNFKPDLDKKVFSSVTDEQNYKNKLELYNLFQERLLDYDNYLKDKEQIRKIRNECQVLLEPIKRED